MDPANGDPPSDSPENFRVDTDEIAAMEQLRQEHLVEVSVEEGLAQRLKRLWSTLEGAPRLARLVRLDAERRAPSPETTPLQLVRADEPPCRCHETAADEVQDQGHDAI